MVDDSVLSKESRSNDTERHLETSKNDDAFHL
jgi:hypothetical protein